MLANTIPAKRGGEAKLLYSLLCKYEPLLAPMFEQLTRRDIMVGEDFRFELLKLLPRSDAIKLWCLLGSGKHLFWPVLGQLTKDLS